MKNKDKQKDSSNDYKIPVFESHRGTEYDDRINGQGENDYIYGYGGDDHLIGGDGYDYLIGHEGDDRLIGGEGNDQLSGFEGDDVLMGGEGDDILSGYLGDDRLIGGDGSDTLLGGDGNDTLNGGEGRDYFIFPTLSGTDHGQDIINGFSIDEDRISFTVVPPEDLFIEVSQGAHGAVINYSSESFGTVGQITLTGIKIDQIGDMFA